MLSHSAVQCGDAAGQGRAGILQGFWSIKQEWNVLIENIRNGIRIVQHQKWLQTPEQTWNNCKVFEPNTLQFSLDHLRDIWNLRTELKHFSLDPNEIRIRLCEIKIRITCPCNLSTSAAMKTSFLVDKTVEPPVSLSASCDVRLDVEEAELGSGLTESLLVSGGGDFVRTCETKKERRQ